MGGSHDSEVEDMRIKGGDADMGARRSRGVLRKKSGVTMAQM